MTTFSAADLQAAIILQAKLLDARARGGIVRVLREAGDKQLTPSQIAAACGLKPVNVRKLLARMLKNGTVEKATYGKYTFPSSRPVTLSLLASLLETSR
jgi:predicted transcriptional regulator of viral defense system